MSNNSDLTKRHVQEGGETKGVTEDKTTWVSCDAECGTDAEAVFHEITTPEGKQVVVWYGYPPGWLLIVQGETIAHVCSRACAWTHSTRLFEELR